MYNIVKKIFNIKVLLFLTLIGICFISVDPVFANENNTYSGEYTIEDMISKYNVVTIGRKRPEDTSWWTGSSEYGTVSKFIHLVGPILISGDVGTDEAQVIDHSQKVYGISSYIKGRIVSPGHAGGDSDNTDNTNPTFYVGENNSVVRYCELYNWGCNDSNKNNYKINGFDYYTKYPTVRLSTEEEYIDFNKLYDSITKEQSALKKGEVVSPDEEGIVYLESGGVYTIESVSDVKDINILNYNKDELTLITVKDSGNINKFPRVLLDDSEVSTNDYIYKNGSNEKYYGNIVFSLPNVTKVNMTQAPFIGHFIAPNADVEMPEMHFAGAFVVNSLRGSGNSEAHMYPYKLGMLPKESESNDSDNNESNSNINDDKGVKGSNETEIIPENPETLDNITMSRGNISVLILIILGLMYSIYKNNQKEN